MPDRLATLSLALVPRLYVALSSLWFATCRLEVRGQEHFETMLAHGSGVIPCWHYSVFYMLYHLRKYPGVAMVSASRDGEYIARVAHLLNFETVRGSSNRFGVRALKGMVDQVKRGKNAGIIADGSQGPALQVQAGAILVAAKSGAPIVPMVWAVQRYKAFQSWDRTVLPLPFSPMIMEYGEPIWVAPELKAETLEQHRLHLERTMLTMYHRLWRQYGKEFHA